MPKCRFCDHNIPVGTSQCPNCRAPVDINTPQLAEELEQQIQSLLDQGQKIKAVNVATRLSQRQECESSSASSC